MITTRNNIIDTIIGRSQLFPNCNLKRIGDILYIELLNPRFKKTILKANVSGMEAKTYYDVAKWLEINKNIKIE